MPKFLLRATYTPDGLKGLLKDGGTARVDVVRGAIESAGGRLESFYFGIGTDDAYLVFELPDPKAAAALAYNVRAAGGATITVVPLLTAEEIDGAVRQKVDYRAPGT